MLKDCRRSISIPLEFVTLELANACIQQEPNRQFESSFTKNHEI
jgi:hypothetical protein